MCYKIAMRKNSENAIITRVIIVKYWSAVFRQIFKLPVMEILSWQAKKNQKHMILTFLTG